MSLLPLVARKVTDNVAIDTRAVVEVTEAVDSHWLRVVCIHIRLLGSCSKGLFIQAAKALDVAAVGCSKKTPVLAFQNCIVLIAAG